MLLRPVSADLLLLYHEYERAWERFHSLLHSNQLSKSYIPRLGRASSVRQRLTLRTGSKGSYLSTVTVDLDEMGPTGQPRRTHVVISVDKQTVFDAFQRNLFPQTKQRPEQQECGFQTYSRNLSG